MSLLTNIITSKSQNLTISANELIINSDLSMLTNDIYLDQSSNLFFGNTAFNANNFDLTLSSNNLTYNLDASFQNVDISGSLKVDGSNVLLEGSLDASFANFYNKQQLQSGTLDLSFQNIDISGSLKVDGSNVLLEGSLDTSFANFYNKQQLQSGTLDLSFQNIDISGTLKVNGSNVLLEGSLDESFALSTNVYNKQQLHSGSLDLFFNNLDINGTLKVDSSNVLLEGSLDASINSLIPYTTSHIITINDNSYNITLYNNNNNYFYKKYLDLSSSGNIDSITFPNFNTLNNHSTYDLYISLSGDISLNLNNELKIYSPDSDPSLISNIYINTLNFTINNSNERGLLSFYKFDNDTIYLDCKKYYNLNSLTNDITNSNNDQTSDNIDTNIFFTINENATYVCKYNTLSKDFSYIDIGNLINNNNFIPWLNNQVNIESGSTTTLSIISIKILSVICYNNLTNKLTLLIGIENHINGDIIIYKVFFNFDFDTTIDFTNYNNDSHFNYVSGFSYIDNNPTTHYSILTKMNKNENIYIWFINNNYISINQLYIRTIKYDSLNNSIIFYDLNNLYPDPNIISSDQYTVVYEANQGYFNNFQNTQPLDYFIFNNEGNKLFFYNNNSNIEYSINIDNYNYNVINNSYLQGYVKYTLLEELENCSNILLKKYHADNNYNYYLITNNSSNSLNNYYSKLEKNTNTNLANNFIVINDGTDQATHKITINTIDTNELNLVTSFYTNTNNLLELFSLPTYLTTTNNNSYHILNKKLYIANLDSFIAHDNNIITNLESIVSQANYDQSILKNFDLYNNLATFTAINISIT